jgi:Flp pilus assembly secretin CpaC
MHPVSRLSVVSVSLLCTLTVGGLARAQAPATSALPMTLGVNDQRILSVPGITQVAVGDDKVADIKTLGHGELLVTGLAPGHTSLRVMVGKVTRQLDIDVAVGAPSKAAAAEGIADVTPEPTEPVTLKVAEVVTRKVKDLERVSVGNPEVADLRMAKGSIEVSVVGVKAGTTQVLLWLKGGHKQLWRVEVK